jgi:hypothetical protein
MFRQVSPGRANWENSRLLRRSNSDGNESIPSPHHRAKKPLGAQSVRFPCLSSFVRIKFVFSDAEGSCLSKLKGTDLSGYES